jgi:TRAP-type transport system periplasmic protein
MDVRNFVGIFGKTKTSSTEEATMKLKNQLFHFAAATAVLAVASFAGSQIAGAKEFKLTASSSHPPIIPWVAVIKNHVVPESVKRAKALGHTIKWTQAYAGALYNFKNTLEGIQEGLGDIGWVGTLWEPNKLPLQNATFYMPFVTDNVQAASEIQVEMIEQIPAYKQAFVKHNQVFLGPQTIDDYVIISKVPIKSVADLKGKKFYAPGASAQWLKGTGAVAVNGALPLYYNGIKTGVTVGAIIPGMSILPFKLHEVAPHIITVGFGGGITGALTMNEDTFKSLPPELQKMFRQLGKEYGQKVAAKVAALHKAHFSGALPKAGAKLFTFPKSEQMKWAKSLPDIAGTWAKGVEAKGAPANLVIKTYMDGVRKRGIKPVREWDK